MRVQFWPIWAVVLGLWFPLDFVSVLDGYYNFLRIYQFPFVFAAGWAMHAIPVLLLVAAAALLARTLVRWPALSRGLQWLVVAAARSLAVLVFGFLVLGWLKSVWPAGVADLGRPRLALGLIALAGGLLATWRRPQPGPLLHLARKIAIGSGIAAALLLPVEAVLTAIQTRHAAPAATLAAGDKPDVILITIDTLAANHMSLYGYERATTPRLDALAQHAAVFDRYYANSNFTTPTSASFLYGVRSWTHRAWNVGAPPVDSIYGANLLRQFHDAGYRVMTVDTNPCAAPVQNRLLPWVDEASSHDVQTAFLWSYLPSRWLPSFDASFVSKPYHKSLRVIDQAMLLLGVYAHNGHFAPELALAPARKLWQADKSRPRFLWVHLFGPHDPYAAPPEYLGYFDPSAEHRTRFDSTPPYLWAAGYDPTFPGSLVGRYDEGIRNFDQHVGDFVDWLRQQGEFDGTLIAISADHGESFGRGYGGHGGPLLFDDLIHVPLIVKAPHAQAGSRNRVVAEQVDLPQILLQLAGLPPIAGAEGRAIALDADEDDDPAFSMNFERNRRFDALQTGTVAMIQRQWKYVRYHNLKTYLNMPAVADELYDLQADPAELHNLIEREPGRAVRMKTAILEQLQIHGQAVR